MKSIRYVLLALLLAPLSAFAQGPDSVNVVVNGVIYGGYASLFPPTFTEGEPAFDGAQGLISVQSDPGDGFSEEACNPITNGDDVAGNVAFIVRGSCSFVQKVTNAVNAGAIGAIIYNNSPRDDDPDGTNLISMAPAECDNIENPRCEIPSVFLSANSGQAILQELPFGADVQFDAIRVTLPPPEPTAGNVNSGTVSLGVYDSGFFGNAPSAAEVLGFTFGDDGPATLFGGSVLVGVGPGEVDQDYGATAPAYTTISPVADITNVPQPYTSGVTYTIASDLGVEIQVNTYEITGAPYVVVELVHTNTTGAELTGVYTGIAADWDVGDFAANQGAFDEETDLVWAFDNSGTSTNYYGISSLDLDASGWTLEYAFPNLFEQMTTPGAPVTEDADVRAAVAVGPIDFPAGGTAAARFAFVAGEDVDAILANAAAAKMSVATEETTPVGTYVLESAFPNPFNTEATINFAVPTTEEVMVEVYDLLGRQVAVLAEGVRQAGTHSVTFDATDLPSGVYVYRLTAGDVSLTERMTVVR